MEAATGDVLYEFNADDRRYPVAFTAGWFLRERSMPGPLVVETHSFPAAYMLYYIILFRSFL